MALALSLCAAVGCDHAAAPPVHDVAGERKPDRLAALDVRGVIASCERPVAEPPVPTWSTASPPREGGVTALVFVAHPDDESMYAGGTLVRLAEHGHASGVVLLTHGEGGRLLVRGDGGELVERRDFTPEEVVRVRDAEMSAAAQALRADHRFLMPASAKADFGWTTSCEESLATWDRTLPGGLRAVLVRMVTDLRQRRPRIVITLDPRDDPQASHHGHHKAVGVLAELAARLAGDPDTTVGGAPYVVEEVLTTAPADSAADVVVSVDPAARRRALLSHASQFWPKDLDGFGMRPDERFVLRWRARGAGSDALLPQLVQR